MPTSGGPHIINNGLVFAWHGADRHSWKSTDSNTHYDLVSGNSGTKTGGNSLGTFGTNEARHVDFNGGGTRNCYISFPSANITVPTGDEGTWIFASYFVDAGSIDHPNFGKETSNGWNGVNGFVFGTGYGTDGPRWGIGGTSYAIYGTTEGSTGDYRTNVWQVYAITYTRNTVNGLKTYLLDSNGQRLVDERTTSDAAIGSNSNALHIGATNIRGGNWNGYMDFVYMWNRALTQGEVYKVLQNVKKRFL